MSERAGALEDAIYAAMPGHGNPSAVARSICEHLGVTWELVELMEMEQDEAFECGAVVDNGDLGRRALATLLEAAGIER